MATIIGYTTGGKALYAKKGGLVTSNPADAIDAGGSTKITPAGYEQAVGQGVTPPTENVVSAPRPTDPKPQTDLGRLLELYKPKDVPENEFRKALEEAQKYFGYKIPTEKAPAYYPVEKEELEERAEEEEERAREDYEYNLEQIKAEKKSLLEDYREYLEGLTTGEIKAGTTYQTDLARRLEEKRIWLEQQELANRQAVEQLQRGWIARGGLWAGPRYEAARRFERGAGLARERYELDWQAGRERAEKEARRTWEEYTRRAERYGELKERRLEDIALQRIRDVRGLQEKYQEAIARRMATTLGEKYYGYSV